MTPPKQLNKLLGLFCPEKSQSIKENKKLRNWSIRSIWCNIIDNNAQRQRKVHTFVKSSTRKTLMSQMSQYQHNQGKKPGFRTY